MEISGHDLERKNTATSFAEVPLHMQRIWRSHLQAPGSDCWGPSIQTETQLAVRSFDKGSKVTSGMVLFL